MGRRIGGVAETDVAAAPAVGVAAADVAISAGPALLRVVDLVAAVASWASSLCVLGPRHLLAHCFAVFLGASAGPSACCCDFRYADSSAHVPCVGLALCFDCTGNSDEGGTTLCTPPGSGAGVLSVFRMLSFLPPSWTGCGKPQTKHPSIWRGEMTEETRDLTAGSKPGQVSLHTLNFDVINKAPNCIQSTCFRF